MMRFMALVRRDIGNLLSSPMLFLYNTLFPILMTLILGFLGNGDYSGSGVNAYDYYGISILVLMLLNVSVTAANTFMEHTLKNANLRVIHSPIPRSWTYLSKIASTTLFTGTCFLLMMALNAFVLGVDYGGVMAGYVITLMLAFNLMSSALGVLFCCIFKSEEVSNKILSFITAVMATAACSSSWTALARRRRSSPGSHPQGGCWTACSTSSMTGTFRTSSLPFFPCSG